MRMAILVQRTFSPLLLGFLLSVPLPSTGQNVTTNSTASNTTTVGTTPTTTISTINSTASTAQINSVTQKILNATQANLNAILFPPPNSNSTPASGCGPGLSPVYSYLCDKQAAWGIVVETLATLGFLVAVGLLLGLLVWAAWLCCSPGRRHLGLGSGTASTALFLLATAGVFALTFAFIVRPTQQTCPVRVFLFGVLFALAFAALLARGLALLGAGAARGWGEVAIALGLAAVQVIIATEWLIVVLVRDGLPCSYSQGEFVMLLIYVLCLLAAALLVALHCLCGSCWGQSYPSGARRQSQAVTLVLTLLLSACIWVVWVALLTRGNPDMGRRPQWDDPVLSVALVANGWVFLLGYVMTQVAYLCRGGSRVGDSPLDFSGWTSPGDALTGLGSSHREGKVNGGFENDNGDQKGKRADPKMKSPYDSGFSMTEIDPDKDYSIPRPQTTITGESYDPY